MNALLPILLAVSAAAPADGPLRAAEPVAHLGRIKGGPPLRHAFVLTHHGGPGTLHVTGVDAGCGCLRQSLETGVLKPGESTRLTMEVNTLTQPDGPNRWSFRVRYQVAVPSAPGQPEPPPRVGELELFVTAVLGREVTIDPPQLAVSTAGAFTRELKLTDRRAKPLTVVKAVGSVPYLTAAVGSPAATDGGRVQPVVLTVAADAPGGVRDEVLVLHTDDPEYPEFRVPVRVQKRSPDGVAAYPEAVAVRFAAGQGEASGLVQLRRADGGPVAVERVECDHPAVRARWSPGAGPVATVRVTVGADAGPAGGCEVRAVLAEPAGQRVPLAVTWAGGR